MITLSTNHRGYIFMISILIVGIITIAVTTSILLLATSSIRTAQSLEYSEQALSHAQACAEHALRSLWENINYTGDDELQFDHGSCYILPTAGSGNTNRAVCVEGSRGSTNRRLEIIIQQVLPAIKIYAWQEVVWFSSCSY